uniref:GAGA-binding transcriptional activator n=1 Tax=Davidia involucrata TaxID=16924 RepID=A0A5B7BQJ0_DAVIN
MDDDGLNMRNWGYYEPSLKGHLGRNWGYYEPSLKGHLGLQLMSSVTERNTKPFLSGRDHTVMISANGAFHPRDCVVSEAPVHMDYVRDSWVNQRDKFLNMLPGNPNFTVLPEPSGTHPMQILQPPDSSKDVRVGMEDPGIRKEVGPLKKRTGGNTPKTPKMKKTKKGPSVPKEDNGSSSVQRAKPAKKNMDVVINGIDMDISGIPIPVCSCTGAPQQCYRWGCGGWQSACCTTTISVYPLPMSTKRRGARIAGRKMSLGAFKKVLEKFAAEGYNFSNPIDLRTLWAKHGTNKFVTIR